MTLRRHLEAEQAVLVALAGSGAVPGAAELAAADRVWRPDGGPVRIDVGNLPADEARAMCVERLLRLRPGQSAELRARDSKVLDAVGRWLRGFDSARFGLSSTRDGAGHMLQVRRRDAAVRGANS